MLRLLLPFILISMFGKVIAQSVVSIDFPNRQQLPTGQLNRIYQDSEGYFWYGTEGGGLCRDDGYMVEIFRSDYNTPGLLESNSITGIAEDSQNRIWFGTKRGAYILDKKDYSIYPLKDKELKGWMITTIDVFSDSSIWISSGNYLYRYNMEQERTGTYLVEWKGDVKVVSQLYEDKGQNIWLMQWRGGLLRFDPEQDRFIPFSWPFTEGPVCMLEDLESPYYWIATWGRGMVRFDPREEDPARMFVVQLSTYRNVPANRRRISGMVRDSAGYLWVRG